MQKICTQRCLSEHSTICAIPEYIWSAYLAIRTILMNSCYNFFFYKVDSKSLVFTEVITFDPISREKHTFDNLIYLILSYLILILSLIHPNISAILTAAVAQDGSAMTRGTEHEYEERNHIFRSHAKSDVQVLSQ